MFLQFFLTNKSQETNPFFSSTSNHAPNRRTESHYVYDVFLLSIASRSSKYCTITIIKPTQRFSSAIGSMIACATEKGVCFLGFIGQKKLEKHLESIAKEFNAILLPGKNQHLTLVKKEMNEYYQGSRTKFSVPLDIIGTEFRKKVWNELLNIPYGKTISYKEQSERMKRPKAIRAMATANGANRISIIIPCHRVIGSNGSLTGYAGGVQKKSWLLNFELLNS